MNAFLFLASTQSVFALRQSTNYFNNYKELESLVRHNLLGRITRNCSELAQNAQLF